MSNIECKFCGEDELTWKEDAGWRLYDIEGNPHNCKATLFTGEEEDTLEDITQFSEDTFTCLVFDTETTGFSSDKYPARHPKQGRICQVAFLLVDQSGRTLAEFSSLVAPDEWQISEGAKKVHGLSDTLCADHGLKSRTVFQIFQRLAKKADIIVAFNLKFDMKMLNIEAKAHGLEMPTFKAQHCAMLDSVDVCKIPNARGSGYKWPKLPEALHALTGEELGENAHDAMVDTVACKKVYFALREKGVYGG